MFFNLIRVTFNNLAWPVNSHTSPKRNVCAPFLFVSSLYLNFIHLNVNQMDLILLLIYRKLFNLIYLEMYVSNSMSIMWSEYEDKSFGFLYILDYDTEWIILRILIFKVLRWFTPNSYHLA